MWLWFHENILYGQRVCVLKVIRMIFYVFSSDPQIENQLINANPFIIHFHCQILIKVKENPQFCCSFITSSLAQILN